MKTYLNVLGNPWRMVDELLNGFPMDSMRSALRAQTRQYPRVNVWENENGLIFEAEVAGVEPADLDISAEGSSLVIKGTKRFAPDEAPVEFQRGFNLPFELDPEKVKATVKNGLLTVSVSRKQAEQRKIAIEVM
ncbi:MAG: Hsp20/alpha crystallin family protein [Kiritimatiellae bacterium]|nr:Hsp20/alpha crystallin family protein [Kiritimatiellia bacterium]